jgi:ribosomal-protein-alanine N-acetyltransferase
LARGKRSLPASVHDPGRARILAASDRRTATTKFCIEVNGAVAGGIGVRLGEDVHPHTATVGYWLGEDFWGRGIMSEAVAALTDFCFENFPLRRISAQVFANNPASACVLEKAGFVFEARLKNNVIKDGAVLDSLLYARTK